MFKLSSLDFCNTFLAEIKAVKDSVPNGSDRTGFGKNLIRFESDRILLILILVQI
jgi:hypothetical protein